MSGFLIGEIVIANRDADNVWRVFYTRRLLRIFPLYYLLLSIVTVFTLLTWIPMTSRGLAPYFFYLQNIIGDLQDPGPVWLQPTWSLAIENSFICYFHCWPFVRHHGFLA